jgi:ubiquinone/menaquinone biosynthesis C-methylase UbiE
MKRAESNMASEAYYDEKSASYDAVFNSLYYKVYDTITWKYVEPYLPTSPGALVLDAAGGTGRWALRMAGKGCNVVLIDNSAGMLKAAAERAEAEGLQQRVTLTKGDIARTDYPDETFDMILCEHALFLFEHPETLLKELRRLAKKQAPLIISAQNRYALALSTIPGKPTSVNMEMALKMLQSKEHFCLSEDGQVKVYTWAPEEFRKMLEENGLHVERIIGKVITMPIRIKKETYMQSTYTQDLYDRILQLELDLCERPDALGLAGHLQAITRKI